MVKIKNLLLLLGLLLVISCSSKELPTVRELDQKFKINATSLENFLWKELDAGLFDRKIHFATGGDSGWLDPTRKLIKSHKLNAQNASVEIAKLKRAIKLNNNLIALEMNPVYFKEQNAELAQYLKELEKVKEYFLLIKELKDKE